MIVSLCGNKEDKEVLINSLGEVYGDKILVCDYFHLCFNACVEYEKLRYDLVKKYDFITAIQMFREHINKIVDDKIKCILNTKDKIIILTSDNILSKDINNTPYFDISDLKILLTPRNNMSSILWDKNLYDKKQFDIVLDVDSKIDIKKLVRI